MSLKIGSFRIIDAYNTLLSFNSSALSFEKALVGLTEYNYKAAKLRSSSALYYVYIDFENDRLKSLNKISNK